MIFGPYKIKDSHTHQPPFMLQQYPLYKKQYGNKLNNFKQHIIITETVYIFYTA